MKRQISSWSSFLITGIFATLVVAILFNRVFEPKEVLFANDAPLGKLSSQSDIVWSNFKSYWADCEWVGSHLPSGTPSLTPFSYAVLGPVGFLKFHVPLSLLFLGFSAWFFCRQSNFSFFASGLTAVAAALNSNPVSYSCWGLPGKALTQGLTLIAVGFAVKSSREWGWRAWINSVLSGFAVGFGVMEGADVGAIFSLLVAAFTVVISTTRSADSLLFSSLPQMVGTLKAHLMTTLSVSG